MIPNSPPPTLNNPEDYSNDFNDFLRMCLQKDPTKRPDAETLLSTNPFIVNAPPKRVIASLVDQCMPMIDEYRLNESKEAENDSSGDGSNGTADTDISTIEQKNYVKASGTMVAAHGDGGDFGGTMVVADSNNKPELPSFMHHFRNKSAASDDKKNDFSATMKPKNKSELQHFYRTGRQLDVSPESSLVELQQALIILNKAYDEESNALEAFYEQRRKELNALIAAKKKQEPPKVV